MRIDARDSLDFLNQNIDHLATTVQPLWHPLGFSSCVIREIKGQYILRVHYWPPNERRTKNPDWPIHTHAYTLSSLILHGQVEDIQYDTTDGDEYIVYKVAYANGNSEIIKAEEGANITSKNSVLRVAGDQYRVERGIFHQSLVELGRSAVTLVALSDISNEAPLVLGEAGELRYPYDRTPFDRELFWSVVRDSITS
ncbi:MAG: hypothetical protein JO142_14995 [Burkholderiales bacterium]|nr:hypothetical protein [Burkholderiales bacterium]